MKYISVVGQPHSGSTILARWLSQLDGAVALGEIQDWFDGKSQTNQDTGKVCSCSKTMDECPVWGVTKSWEDIEKLPCSIVIDSHKKTAIPNSIVICIYKNFWQLFKSYRRTMPNLLKALYATWIRRNPNPSQSNVDLFVSYDDFVDKPQVVLERVSNLLGVGVTDKETSHVALSNRSKYSPLVICKK